MEKTNQQTDLDRQLAQPMFVVTMLWLGLAGIAIHLMADIEGRYQVVASGCGIVLMLLWGVLIFEFWLHAKSKSKQLKQHLKMCLFPPLRLGARDHVTGTTVWIPGMGWRIAGDDLASEIERKLSYAMIAIAMLVLPLLAVEFFYTEQIQNNRTFGLVIQLAQAFIWFAFASEFLLMISLVTKRLRFVKKHWLDLAIICLPMIAFMRVFRLSSAARLSRLTKTARVFRVRGLAMRAWRAILILQIVDRIINRDPEQKILLLKDQIKEKKLEIESLEAEIQRLEKRIENSQLMASSTTSDSEVAQS